MLHHQEIKGQKIWNSTDDISFLYLLIIIAQYLLRLSEENVIWDPIINKLSYQVVFNALS